MTLSKPAALLFSRIHIRRYSRMINQLGLFRALFLAAVVLYILKVTLKPGMLQWQSILVLSAIAGSHFNRKDHHLLNNLGLNNPLYFISLYFLFASPFLLIYIFWPDYRALAILLTGIPVISLFKRPLAKTRSLRLPAFRFLPAGLWEWRVGLRQYLPAFILSYVIPALFYRHDFLFTMAILVIAITVNSFHIYHEPEVMMKALRLSPPAYLRYKLLMQCMLFLAFSLPLVTTSVILYPGNIRPVLLVLINSLIVQIFAVSIKYSGYSPAYRNPYSQAISFLLNFAFVMPALLPLPVIMAAIFTRKAFIRLKVITP